MKQAGKKDLQMLELDLCVNANHDFSVTRVHIWRLNFKVILGKRLDLNDTSQCWTDGCRPEISYLIADFVWKEGSRKGLAPLLTLWVVCKDDQGKDSSKRAKKNVLTKKGYEGPNKDQKGQKYY